jgi:transcriptional regulator GlxA family with amidase domain
MPAVSSIDLSSNSRSSSAYGKSHSAFFINVTLLHCAQKLATISIRQGQELTLQEMAQCAGLSTAHFSQMFRKSTGESPRQFVLRERVERAKEMLCSGEMRVLDVAVACGFKTQQHFARVFRRICGASPTEYRYEVLR